MSPRWCWLLLAACPLLLQQPPPSGAKPARAQPHRSPADVALLPGGRLALTANHTADSASLVDLAEGKALAELPCGRKPAGVAVSADGRRAAVSNLWSDSLSLFEIDGNRLRPLGEVPVGHQPRGLAFAPDGRSLFADLAGGDEVAQLDWASREVTRRLPAPREPRQVVLTKDGKQLIAASMRSSQVRCWDAATGKLVWERAINDSFNLLGLALTPDGQDVVTTQVHTRHHPIIKHNIEQGWALNSRVARMSLRPDADRSYTQIALDVRNKAVGDPTAVAFTQAGDVLAVVAAGTQEVLLVQSEAIP
ncbi:MAG: YncE family protein [Gemmataceae bacterium]